MLKNWDKDGVLELVKRRISDYLFVVASNRQPYIHRFVKGKIESFKGPGGVITALDPVMRQIKGLWVCCGTGNADRVVVKKTGKVKVPHCCPSYEVKYLWLSKEENLGYYFGFANQSLWPLFHLAFVKPKFRQEDWGIYKDVNKKFAQSIAEEIGDKKAVVFVQDYHLSLVSKYLKQICPQVITLLFWHIPWCNYDIFKILPYRQEFLAGLLSYDLLGFHISYFAHNFLEAVRGELEAKVNLEQASVVYQRHRTLVRHYPISVDFVGIDELARNAKVEKLQRALEKEFALKNYKVIIGLDRIDYTKGIPERIRAVDLLLEKNPSWKGKMVFIQMGEMSRIHIPEYKMLNDRINSLVEEVNFRHSQNSWAPIIFLRRHLSFEEIVAFYRRADVCLVTSLHDGMNLVAKEFVSARCDGGGALVLSRFTGAARELKGAISCNPYSEDDIARALIKALTLEENEVRQNMQMLRQQVSRNNIWRWIAKIIGDIPLRNPTL
ncbi:MAG: trehalose-6-phosphate synthase [Candidatus Omnitrophica bacterium]|nr:trehalose-6-phosphate synthase [Candidatus Omnitrophota bacterium]